MSTVAAATIASPIYQAGETMALADLSTQSGLGVVLPAGKWVCLGLVLPVASGSEDNNRILYLALRLVQVCTGEHAAGICDGTNTDGHLQSLDADGQKSGIYVAFGLYVDAQLFSADFAREFADGKLEAINPGKQRANVCAFDSVYALLALNPWLCEMLALGGALTMRDEENSGAKAIRTLQCCVFTAIFGEASCME